MPPGAARTEVVGSFRVTAAEADALFLHALRTGKSVREVLREFVRSLQDANFRSQTIANDRDHGPF